MKLLTFHFRKVRTGVLLIRHDNLGDFLISLPVFEQIAEYVHAENKSVTIAVTDSMESFCREFSCFDNVIALSHASLSTFLNRVSAYRKITSFLPEKTILFNALGRSGEYDYMALLPRSRECYVLETMDSWPVSSVNRKFRNLFFNRKYTAVVPYDVTQTLAFNEAALAQCAMKRVITPRLANSCYFYSLSPLKEVTAPFYIVVPGASDEKRQWPAENYASLIDRLSSEFPALTVVLAGSSKDKEIADLVSIKCHNKAKIVNLCGKTSLKELFALIRKAVFLVGNCTAPRHIAPLFDILSFSIGGAWHLGAYGPNPLYKKDHYFYVDVPCKRCMGKCYSNAQPFVCLKLVTVSQVFEKIVKEMKGEII